MEIMSKTRLCWFAAAFYCCEGLGQTNCPPSRSLFLLPRLELKKLECDPEQARQLGQPERTSHREPLVAPAVSVTLSTNSASSAAGDVALNSSVNDDFFQKLDIYRRLDEGGYLTRPAINSENLVARSIDSIFRPDPVHVGKATMSCTLLTAIKRKNPLCLLNPIFFQLSW
jgi:hypothetical protein